MTKKQQPDFERSSAAANRAPAAVANAYRSLREAASSAPHSALLRERSVIVAAVHCDDEVELGEDQQVLAAVRTLN